MADELKEYRRKVSAEEVQQSYILIMKEALNFFPKVDLPFNLKFGEETHETRVETHDQWSVGPRKPQLQYRIPYTKFKNRPQLHRGSVVTIKKVAEKEYELVK
jgi:hypothetical protein